MFSSSLASCRCALARVSALFLAIALCLTCRNSRADIAVLPEPYYTNGVVSVEAWCEIFAHTNLFLSYTDWRDTYKPDLTNALALLLDDYNQTYINFQALRRDLIAIGDDFSIALDAWIISFFDSQTEYVLNYLDYDSLFAIYDEVADVLYQRIDILLGDLDDYSAVLEDISYQAQSVRSQINSLDREFQQYEILDSVEVGMEPYDGPPGGGCSCPDYRSYLTYLQGQLDDISSRVQSIENELQRFLDGFATEALSEFGDSAYPATTFGSWLATLLGSLQAVYYRDYEHLNIVSTNVLAHILDGWVYPTNRVDDPLFVSVVDDNLESTLQSIFADLEVTVKQGTNLWNVVVTNQVLVSVTNSLENINDIDVEQTVDDLGGKLDELGQPEEITEEPIDYSTVFEDYKDAAVDLGQSWQSLFTEAVTDTDQMPTSIRLWSGYQPDGTHFDSLVIVPTTYWTISGSVASVCRSIRSVCRFLWLIVEIAIIARLFKINIFLVYQGIIVLFATASALGCPGLQKISWGEALNNIATSFRNNVDMFFPAPEDT